MITENDISWLAGILDGEGFFTTNTRNGIHKTRNNGQGSKSFITRIGVGNTDMEMIKKISEIYVYLGVKFYYTLHRPSKTFPNSKFSVSINAEGYKSTKKIIEAVIEKMNSSKTEQARLMLDYINYRLGLFQPRGKHGMVGAKTTDDDFKNIDLVFVEKMHNCKKYQIPPPTTKRIASTVLQW